MTEQSHWLGRRYREGLIGGISFGFFLIVVGAIFVLTPNLFQNIVDLLNDVNFVQIPNTAIWWIAPVHPLRFIFQTVYTAVQRFSFIWGLFQIGILAARFVLRSPISKKAETSGNIVFSLLASYLIGVFLTGTFLVDTYIVNKILVFTPSLIVWFAFWGAILTLIGVSLIIRAIILAASLAMMPRQAT